MLPVRLWGSWIEALRQRRLLLLLLLLRRHHPLHRSPSTV